MNDALDGLRQLGDLGVPGAVGVRTNQEFDAWRKRVARDNLGRWEGPWGVWQRASSGCGWRLGPQRLDRAGVHARQPLANLVQAQPMVAQDRDRPQAQHVVNRIAAPE